jgi:hypothetical protein
MSVRLLFKKTAMDKMNFFPRRKHFALHVNY